MKITLFTSNKNRHNYLVNCLEKICKKLFVIQEFSPKTNNITANDKSISELKQSKKATNIAKINLLEVIIVGKFFIILN